MRNIKDHVQLNGMSRTRAASSNITVLKGNQGKCGPATEWGRDPGDTRCREGRDIKLLPCFSFPCFWQGQPSGIPHPGGQRKSEEALDVAYLDFRKAFDTVSHDNLFGELRKCGLESEW